MGGNDSTKNMWQKEESQFRLSYRQVRPGLSSLCPYIAVFPVCALLKTDNWSLKPELVSSRPAATLTCVLSRVYKNNLQNSKLA